MEEIVAIRQRIDLTRSFLRASRAGSRSDFPSLRARRRREPKPRRLRRAGGRERGPPSAAIAAGSERGEARRSSSRHRAREPRSVRRAQLRRRRRRRRTSRPGAAAARGRRRNEPGLIDRARISELGSGGSVCRSSPRRWGSDRGGRGFDRLDEG